MLKFIGYVFIGFAFFTVQSCQRTIEDKQEQAIKEQRLHNAATYNTQLGIAYLRQGDRSRAKQKLITAVDLAPNDPDVNMAMGYFLEKTGDLPRARAFYKKALTSAPNSGVQLNNYGTFLCRTGHYKQAEIYFLKAVNELHSIHSAGAYENAGLCAAAIPDDKKAIYYFKKALEQEPNRKQSLAEIARIERK